MSNLDEFTEYRLKHIAKRFCKIYKKQGLTKGSEYLDTMNIDQKHYYIVSELINQELREMGLSL